MDYVVPPSSAAAPTGAVNRRVPLIPGELIPLAAASHLYAWRMSGGRAAGG